MRKQFNHVSAVICLEAAICAVLLATAPRAKSSFKQEPQAPPAASAPFHEEVIAEITPGNQYKSGFVGYKHLAWVENQGGKRIVRLDGKQQGGVYDDVKYLGFNQDESHFVFFAKHRSSWVFVQDGQEYPPEYSKPSSVEFQPKASSYAFCACHEKKCRLVIDGTEAGDEYTDISRPEYSRDGKRLAFVGKRGKKWIAIVDGKETGPELDDFWYSGWGFSRDVTHFFVAGRIKANWLYAIDGQQGPGFDVLSRIAFSRDGTHYAFGGIVAKGGFKKQKTFGTMVLDGKPIATYEGKGMAGGLVQALGNFSESLTVGVWDLSPDFHGISTPQFNPEGKLVYAARRDKGDVAVFVGPDAGPGFDEVLSPVAFSEDAQHFAYVARDGDNFVEVRDNVPGRSFTSTRHKASDVQWIAMNHDATHLAYETVSGGNQYMAGTTSRALRSVVIDGQSGPEYDALGVSEFGFSKDAAHYFYEVHGAKGDQGLVNVDGYESKLYDFVINARFVEDGKGVSFVALDGGRFVRVSFVLK